MGQSCLNRLDCFKFQCFCGRPTRRLCVFSQLPCNSNFFQDLLQIDILKFYTLAVVLLNVAAVFRSCYEHTENTGGIKCSVTGQCLEVGWEKHTLYSGGLILLCVTQTLKLLPHLRKFSRSLISMKA